MRRADLDAERLARRAAEPSTMSPLGLVRHMADVERFWSRRLLAGQGVAGRFRTQDAADGDSDGAVADPAAGRRGGRRGVEGVAGGDRVRGRLR